ncbi:hypothetical protein MYX82_02395 [Acidobacteria bacterium AH-259-D05]|nr:hypothetical protein [Acidobacteria bacterium AH-259-D05]
MNRRDFFRLKNRGTPIFELSCEKLYMRYLDSKMDGTREQFLRRTRLQLRRSRRVRLKDASWLKRGDFGKELDPLLEEFQAGGGLIEYI